MKASEELLWRGFVNQTTYSDLSAFDNKPITFYWGVDPSADSMTIGNLAAAMMVKCLIKYGHKPVLLVGGATGLIGDPDGKAEERAAISQDVVTHNKAAIAEQYNQIFGNTNLTIVDNYDWFKDMNYLTFLRETGKHVPMRQMLSRDFVQSRLGESGAGISYAEFSYVLIQAYDFLYLYENHDVTLQVCGSDQWGNSIAGVDLIRRKTGGEAHVFSAPLIVNKATGKKFGKSEDGAVWLDANKTTPTQFYQFWINADDQGVEDYLKVYAEFSPEELASIMDEHQADPRQRIAQVRLAESVTTLVHGEESMKRAQLVTDFLTGKRDIGEADDQVMSEVRANIPAVKSASLVDSLVAGGLASSNTEARRFLADNAISLNGEKVSREQFEPQDFHNGRLLLRKGKAFKDTILVEQ